MREVGLAGATRHRKRRSSSGIAHVLPLPWPAWGTVKRLLCSPAGLCERLRGFRHHRAARSRVGLPPRQPTLEVTR